MPGYDEFGATSNAIDWGGGEVTSPGYFDLLKQQEVAAGPAGGTAAQPGTLSTPLAPAVGGDVLAGNATNKPGPSFWDKISGAMPTGEEAFKKFQQASPIVAQLGSVIAGRETPTGQAGTVVAGALQSQRLNEQLRKLISEQMGGGAGFQPGQASKPVGISDLDVLGLTPEQITSLYGTAMTVRESERQYPMTVMKNAAEVYNKVATGDYYTAQIPELLAKAEKLRIESANLPTLQRLEVEKRIQDIHKTIADRQKTEEETLGMPGQRRKVAAETAAAEAEPELKAAQAARARTEGYKTDEELRQLRYDLPSGVEAQRTRMELGKQMPFDASSAGGNLVITNKRTGATQLTPIGTVTPESRVTQLAWSMAASTFVNQAKIDLAAKYPNDIQKAKDEFDKLLYTLGKEGVTADVQGTAIRAALNDTNKKKFDAAMDIYRTGEGTYSLETMNKMVEEKVGKMGGAAAPATVTPPVAGATPAIPTKRTEAAAAIKTPKELGYNNVAPQVAVDAFKSSTAKGDIKPADGKGYKIGGVGYYYYQGNLYAK